MKTFLKSTLRFFCTLAVLPMLMMYWLQCAFVGSEKAFPGWSQLLSLLPGTGGIYLRHAFYSNSLRKCDTDASVGFGTIFSHPNAALGHTCYVGNYCSIGDVQIEKDVLIASHVSIMNGCRQHGTSRLDCPIREQQGVYEPVSIGEDTWIGERATIAASIGKHCIVGAGSLVNTPLPDYSVAVGVPAKIIKDRRDMASVDADMVEPNTRKSPEYSACT